MFFFKKIVKPKYIREPRLLCDFHQMYKLVFSKFNIKM